MTTTETASATTRQDLNIKLERDGNTLAYQVTNTQTQPVWVFIHVPTIIKGEFSFATDAAWIEADGDLLLLRKVDTPVPDDVKAERINSGAVQLSPGASRSGRITLGDEVETRSPYRATPTRHPVHRVALEIGWLPVRAGQAREDLTWDGQAFAYLRPEVEPGGQRVARSAVLSW